MGNPYDVLGVPRDADADAIKKAYKALARKFHPDLNKEKSAEQKFKDINAAYDCLGDADKRKLYDEFGDVSTKPGFDAERARAWSKAGGAGAGRGGFPGGFPGGFDASEGVDMEDLLGSIFGAGPGFTGRRERRGRDQNATMQVEPMVAILGGDAHITIPRPDGSHEPLKVRIPAGVKNGGKLRLKGQGLPPQGGGACGDLNIRLDIADHPVLRRDGDDLEMDVPLTVLEAIKGGSITVPTPTGEIKVNVPPGVASGQRLRIKGKGVQKTRSPGDLYLVLRPTVPATQTPEILAAAEAMEAGYGADVRGGLVL